MAFYPEFKGVPLDAYNKMVGILETKAMTSLATGRDGIVVRQLRPEDTGLTTKYWPSLSIGTADTFIPYIDATVANNRFIGINGFMNGESAGEITQIKITRKGSDARYWSVDEIRNWQHKTGWVDDPVTVDENTRLTVSIAARVTSTVSDLAFIGAVAERKGLLVSP
jgi:hypothetical protein